MEIIKQIKTAVELVKKSDYKTAEQIYKTILHNNPEDERVLPFLGWLYVNKKQYSEAKEIFEKITTQKTPNVVTGLGICNYELGLYEEAYPLLKISVDNTPNQDILYKLITCAAENTNQVEVIFNYAQKMLDLYPSSPKSWDCYILAALCAGKFDIAEDFCNKTLEQHPNNPTLLLSAGLIREVMYSDYEQACKFYLKAQDINSSVPALYNIGLAYSRLKNPIEAEKYLLEALESAPDSCEIQKSLYLFYATQKDFKKAYYYFEKSVKPLLSKLKNNWNGESCPSQTLFILADQGFGDIIMYSRYIPLVAKRFKQVIISIPNCLLRLFQTNFCLDNVQFTTDSTTQDYDKSTILTMLPFLLNLDFNNIPNKPYINAENNNTLVIETDNLKVGLAWEAGGTKLRGSLDRTINPKLLKNLLDINKVDYYSLQLNAAMPITKYFPNVKDVSNYINDFSDTATIINKMDVIVTVDTSVAHLAGAMGKKTFLMLPEFCDWRWFGGSKDTTEWYSSVEIHKQPAPMDWITVIDHISQKITDLANSHH